MDKVIKPWETVAGRLRAKMRLGMIYGKQIDMEDHDMVITAAYLIGTSEEMEQRYKDIQHIFDLFKKCP